MTSMVQLGRPNDAIQLRLTSGSINKRDAGQQPASPEALQVDEPLWFRNIWTPPSRDPTRTAIGEGRTLAKTSTDEVRHDSLNTERTRSRSGGSSSTSSGVPRPGLDRATVIDEHDQKWTPATSQRSRGSSFDTRSSTSRDVLLNSSGLVSGSTADAGRPELQYEPNQRNMVNFSQVQKQWSTVAPFQPSQSAQSRVDAHNRHINNYGLGQQTSIPHQVYEPFSSHRTAMVRTRPGQQASTGISFDQAVQPRNQTYRQGPDPAIYGALPNTHFTYGRNGSQHEELAKTFGRVNLNASSDPFYGKSARTAGQQFGYGHDHLPQSIARQFPDLRFPQNEYRPGPDDLLEQERSNIYSHLHPGDSQGSAQAADSFQYGASKRGIPNYAATTMNGTPAVPRLQDDRTDRSSQKVRNHNERKTNQPWEQSNSNHVSNEFQHQYQQYLPTSTADHQFIHHGHQGSVPQFGHPHNQGYAALTSEDHVHRSPLLEDYRANSKTKRFELKDIYNHIVEFSGDQHGSRFIQRTLEIATSEEKERVFSEIQRDCRQLMTDVFGNYVIQKMFEYGNQAQKKALADQMRGHVLTLSMQMYGCRVVQKALEHILTDQQALLTKELDGQVLKVVGDQNGNHVIQKAIERIPGEHIQFIVDAHRGHVFELSKHTYGCRVIQRMLEHCRPQAKRQILDELLVNIGDLIQDAFGNYVVQHVIANGEPRDRKPVIEKVLSRLAENARHKFASNVVEKAIDYAEHDQRQILLSKLIRTDELGVNQVRELLGHQYGNYVIQKCAAYLQGPSLQLVVAEMEQHLLQLRRISSGKQVTALEKTIRETRQRLTPMPAYDRHFTGTFHAQASPSYHI